VPFPVEDAVLSYVPAASDRAPPHSPPLSRDAMCSPNTKAWPTSSAHAGIVDIAAST
jgi:hypothetical protein